MATMGTKVTKKCPKCGMENEIIRNTSPHGTKHYYICNNKREHLNPFYHERIDIADLIDDLDKMEGAGEQQK